MVGKGEDYQKAVAQAESVNALSKEIDILIGEMQRIIDNISEAWKGEAANAFLIKCDELKQQIDCTGKDMIQLGILIKSFANKKI